MTPLSSSLSYVVIPTLLIVIIKSLHSLLHRRKERLLPFPPGPSPKFLFGNALDFPTEDVPPSYAEWSKKYNSDILHASALGTHLVVVNSLKIAEDLFERRAQLYNDRPITPIGRVIGWEYVTALMPYGAWWRKHRKISHQLFYSGAADQYKPIQTQEVHAFLRNMLHKPDEHDKHNKMLSVAIPLLIGFGYKPDSVDDPIIEIADQTAAVGFKLLLFGGTLINVFPFLRYVPSWVPGAVGKKLAEKCRSMTREMQRIPVERAKSDLAKGQAKSAIMTDFYEKYGTTGFPEEEESILKNISWTTYSGASETTISSTGSFLYLMATHPEVQARAQLELDHVLGSGRRLPDFNDRGSLPYVEAVYRELLRVYPPLPLALPHALTEDDIYEGYFLPKGANVLANIWAMTHDERLYPDPDVFKPERFFDRKGKLNEDSRILAYGFGRRVCVGKAVASNTMWLLIASFLACFTIGPAKDSEGNPVEINGEFDMDGATMYKPFKCSIMPRSQAIQTLIESTMD
ncbi:cytochrome P450 [Crepidotus variabilis]|uniref:Cytochrome P450 n=1 Tax=Crepidotus variabilis TaxID=179855 RepID=A0A9P6ECN2_9AGAR|nr:cytochrome P450 [Crepidotus variabilis]